MTATPIPFPGTYCRLGVHALAGNLAMLRAARGKIAEQHRRDPAMRQARHVFFRAMLHHHAHAASLYLYVQTGAVAR